MLATYSTDGSKLAEHVEIVAHRPVLTDLAVDNTIDVHVSNRVRLSAGGEGEPEGMQLSIKVRVMVMSATTRSPSETSRSITFADPGLWRRSAARRLKSSVPSRPVTWL